MATSHSPVALVMADAEAQVSRFARRFGDAALGLARHAAVPLELSPELVHLLRVNFVPAAAFISEADLLLSPLCEEIGGGRYVMDPAARDLFLDDLRASRGGPARIREIAAFLLRYTDHAQTRATNPDTRTHLQAERWGALAHLDPKQAAEDLARALDASLGDGNTGEVLRITLITDALSAPLAMQHDFVRYAAGLHGLLTHRPNAALLLGEPDRQRTVGRVSLPAPNRLDALLASAPRPGTGSQVSTPVGTEDQGPTPDTPETATPPRTAAPAPIPDHLDDKSGPQRFLPRFLRRRGSTRRNRDGDIIERFARAIHSRYLEHEIANGSPLGSRPTLRPWDALSRDLKNSNRGQAAIFVEALRSSGFTLAPATSDDDPFEFTSDEIEILARAEHDRWRREKEKQGYIYGPYRIDEGQGRYRANPSLMLWEQLDDRDRERDRDVFRNMPAILRDAGIRAVRPTDPGTLPQDNPKM